MECKVVRWRDLVEGDLFTFYSDIAIEAVGLCRRDADGYTALGDKVIDDVVKERKMKSPLGGGNVVVIRYKDN